MLGPIHVFHHNPRERAALERDLRSVALEVHTFDSGPALIAANDERPALVLWDMEGGRVRGGLGQLAQSLRCPVFGLASDQERPRPDERHQTVVLPYERWRVTPLVLNALALEGAATQVVPEVDRPGLFRVLADTVKQSMFDGFERWDEAAAETLAPAITPLPVAPPEEPPVVSAVPGRVRVLLADDDEVLRHILGYQLAARGWDVRMTADGEEAQSLLRTDEFDVLLVDLNLPHKNGFEILEALELAQREPGLRVIVLSEQIQEDKVVRALDLGANDFVQKPLNPRVVVSRIARMLRSA